MPEGLVRAAEVVVFRFSLHPAWSDKTCPGVPSRGNAVQGRKNWSVEGGKVLPSGKIVSQVVECRGCAVLRETALCAGKLAFIPKWTAPLSKNGTPRGSAGHF